MTNVEIEPITGHRIFGLRHVDHVPQPLLVGSFFTAKPWESTTMQAECHTRDKRPEAESTDLELGVTNLAKLAESHLLANTCKCGVYLVKDRSHHSYWQEIMTNSYLQVDADCTAWGVCVEGSIGMRCQFVRIDALTLLIKPCVICSYPAEWFNLSLSLCNDCFQTYIMKDYMMDRTRDYYSYRWGFNEKRDPQSFVRWDTISSQLSEKYEVECNLQPLLAAHFEGESFPYPVPTEMKRDDFHFLVPPPHPQGYVDPRLLTPTTTSTIAASEYGNDPYYGNPTPDMEKMRKRFFSLF